MHIYDASSANDAYGALLFMGALIAIALVALGVARLASVAARKVTARLRRGSLPRCIT